MEEEQGGHRARPGQQPGGLEGSGRQGHTGAQPERCQAQQTQQDNFVFMSYFLSSRSQETGHDMQRNARQSSSLYGLVELRGRGNPQLHPRQSIRWLLAALSVPGLHSLCSSPEIATTEETAIFSF